MVFPWFSIASWVSHLHDHGHLGTQHIPEPPPLERLELLGSAGELLDGKMMEMGIHHHIPDIIDTYVFIYIYIYVIYVCRVCVYMDVSRVCCRRWLWNPRPPLHPQHRILVNISSISVAVGT